MAETVRFLRQIHPSWRDPEAVVAKIAFLPTDKDHGMLSGYDGEQITAKDAFAHYTQKLGLISDAVFGVAVGECDALGHPVTASPREDNPFHIHLDFSNLEKRSVREKIAKRLRDYAVLRGVLYDSVA